MISVILFIIASRTNLLSQGHLDNKLVIPSPEKNELDLFDEGLAENSFLQWNLTDWNEGIVFGCAYG